MRIMEFAVDESLVSRLVLGALSEHEQRMLTAKLARSDAEFRAALLSIVQPFEMFDRDLAEEYSTSLNRSPGDIERRRRRLLTRAFDRAEDLEELIRDFTVRDALQLGEATRRLFSWSMAEFLLKRAGRSAKGSYNARTSLYLAMMVIDVVEILGAAGHSPSFLPLVDDVRRRIWQAADLQGS